MPVEFNRILHIKAAVLIVLRYKVKYIYYVEGGGGGGG